MPHGNTYSTVSAGKVATAGSLIYSIPSASGRTGATGDAAAIYPTASASAGHPPRVVELTGANRRNWRCSGDLPDCQRQRMKVYRPALSS